MENLLTCDQGSINVSFPGKEQIDIGYIRVKGLWVVFFFFSFFFLSQVINNDLNQKKKKL